ncbi:hypothetical protein D3C81_2019120 [compost metagenome]
MAVLACSARIFAVIDVDHAQPLETDNLIKLTQDTVQIANNIISGIMDVAGVQTDR